MTGTEALRLMLTYDEVVKIMLPSSSIYNKKIIEKSNLKSSGIHINATELCSEKWMVGVEVQSNLPDKKEIIWRGEVE